MRASLSTGEWCCAEPISVQDPPGYFILDVGPRVKTVVKRACREPQRQSKCAHQSLADLCQLLHDCAHFNPEALGRWILLLARPAQCACSGEDGSGLEGQRDREAHGESSSSGRIARGTNRAPGKPPARNRRAGISAEGVSAALSAARGARSRRHRYRGARRCRGARRGAMRPPRDAPPGAPAVRPDPALVGTGRGTVAKPTRRRTAHPMLRLCPRRACMGTAPAHLQEEAAC